MACLAFLAVVAEFMKGRWKWIGAAGVVALLGTWWWVFATTRLMHVLVVGTDALNDSRHADTMLLVTVRPATKRVHILSIPRDAMVEGGERGVMKMGEVFAGGFNHGGVRAGAERVLDRLSGLLQVSLRQYCVVEFRGFERAVDELGGVDLLIPKAMDYDDRAANLHIHLPAGWQRLDGRSALHFVRYRADGMGDVGRIGRQQQFLKAVKARMELSKVPALVKILERHVETNLPWAGVVRWADQVRTWKSLEMTTETLPGGLWMNNRISYWKVNGKALPALRERVLQ